MKQRSRQHTVHPHHSQFCPSHLAMSVTADVMPGGLTDLDQVSGWPRAGYCDEGSYKQATHVMQCPNCNEPLVSVDLSEHGLMSAQACRKCDGGGLDKSDLEGVHAGVWANVEAMGASVAETLSATICPRCEIQCTEVSPTDHTELKIDRCPSCHGLWLDRGELDALYRLVTEYGEAHSSLTEKPVDWSALRWLSYRMAVSWNSSRAGFGVESSCVSAF
ncbi:MAG: Zn-finger nucleic acid-binding protein [Gammaproteobacteria bacterium]|jgi:Zn-finger nucleic acid-binding protein